MSLSIVDVTSSDKLLETSLRHHIPGKIRDLSLDYYSCFSLRVTSGTVLSTFHRLEKGIITSCTVSVILFDLAMNMLVKSGEVKCRGPLTRTGVGQPPIRAFMDNLTVTTTSVPGCKWILRDLERLINWAWIDLVPSPSCEEGKGIGQVLVLHWRSPNSINH